MNNQLTKLEEVWLRAWCAVAQHSPTNAEGYASACVTEFKKIFPEPERAPDDVIRRTLRKFEINLPAECNLARPGAAVVQDGALTPIPEGESWYPPDRDAKNTMVETLAKPDSILLAITKQELTDALEALELVFQHTNGWDNEFQKRCRETHSNFAKLFESNFP